MKKCSDCPIWTTHEECWMCNLEQQIVEQIKTTNADKKTASGK